MKRAAGLGAALLALAVGAGTAAAGAPRQASPPLPASALPLELVGVMVDASDPSRSVCLIRCTYPVELTGIFETGQRACEVAAVKEVRADGVVITNLLADRQEFLRLRSADARASTPAAAAASPADEMPAPAPPPTAPAPPVLKKTANVVTIELPDASVAHYLANLPELLESASAVPRYRDTGNGQRVIEGFEVDRIKKGSVVEQMGLLNGDVILELNGEPLDGLPSVIRLFGQAQNRPQSKMTVLRGDQRLTFVLNKK
jgi:type II secretory pathway component PulC